MRKIAFLWYRLACFIIDLDWSVRNHSWTDDTISVRPDIRRILKAFYLDLDYTLPITSRSPFHGKSPREKGVLLCYFGEPIEYQLLSGLRVTIKSIPSLQTKGSETWPTILNRPNCRTWCYRNHLNRWMKTSLLLANLIIISWTSYSKDPSATLSTKNISNASIFWMTEVNILYIF